MDIVSQITALQLQHPFKIARRSTDASRHVISVEIDGGIGETAPTRFYGETVQTVSVALETLAPALPKDLDAIHDVMEVVEATLGGNYAAKSAIDMALHDRLGKRLGAPLYQLWGLNPHKTPCTSFTIGLDEPEVMAEKTRHAEAYPILKVKLGTPQDIEIIQQLRDVTDKPIYVDANTAWTPKEAVRKIRENLPGMVLNWWNNRQNPTIWRDSNLSVNTQSCRLLPMKASSAQATFRFSLSVLTASISNSSSAADCLRHTG